MNTSHEPKPVEPNWNAHLYDDAHAFVHQLGAGVVELLNPQPDETILDLGCGTGHLTAQIAEKGANVVGVDASAPMLQTARETYPEIEWFEADARDFDLHRTFDAVFTNATLHWIPEIERVAARVTAHLENGGRFVGEFGGVGNVAQLHSSLRQAAQELGLPPFEPEKRHYFASVGQWSSVLEDAGFEVRFATLFDRPTPLEGEEGAKNWWRQFCAFYLDDLDEAARERGLQLAEEKARPRLKNENGWRADYRRLRFVAVRELE